MVIRFCDKGLEEGKTIKLQHCEHRNFDHEVLNKAAVYCCLSLTVFVTCSMVHSNFTVHIAFGYDRTTDVMLETAWA